MPAPKTKQAFHAPDPKPCEMVLVCLSSVLLWWAESQLSPQSCCWLHLLMRRQWGFYPIQLWLFHPITMHWVRCSCISLPRGAVNLQGSVLMETNTNWRLWVELNPLKALLSFFNSRILFAVLPSKPWQRVPYACSEDSTWHSHRRKSSLRIQTVPTPVTALSVSQGLDLKAR